MNPPTHVYSFGEFRLDPHTLELWRGEEPVPLEPRPAQILLRLVERAGRMVGRRELRELGWPRLPEAAEQSLNTCIRQIRDALGDDAAAPTYIATLRGRGYRFEMPVTAAGDDTDRYRTSTAVPVRKRRFRVAAVTLLLLAVLATTWMVSRPGPHPMRILVEPTVVVGEIADSEVLSAALSDEIRAALATVAPDRLEVFGRTSTIRILGGYTHPGANGAADRIRATHVLSLSVRTPEPGALRLVARLVNTDDGTVAWGGGADTEPVKLAAAAADLTRDLAESFGLTVSGSAPRTAELPLETRRALLKARHLFEGYRDLPVALAVLDSLLARDPRVAEGHGLRAEVLLAMDEPRRAAAAAERALRLDAASAGGLRALAGVRMLAGDWEQAESALQDALGFSPNDPATLNALAFLHSVRGRFTEADRALRQASRVDPLSPALVGDAGLMYLWAGRYDDAERACAETLQLDPSASWALGCLFDSRVRAGKDADAATAGRRILAALGATELPHDVPPDSIVREVRRRRVQSWERAVPEGAPRFFLAAAYADAGRVGDALAALEHAADHPTLALLTTAVDPRFAPVSNDPRFRAVLRRLNLPVARVAERA